MTTDQPSTSISTGRLLLRGLMRRCPACGEGRQFTSWFRMREQCRRCRLRFERIEGHWIGALGINTVLSSGLLLITLVVGLITTFPDFPVGRLVAANVTVAVLAPVILWPFTRTIWTAIDIAMRPLEIGEADVTAEPGRRLD